LGRLPHPLLVAFVVHLGAFPHGQEQISRRSDGQLVAGLKQPIHPLVPRSTDLEFQVIPEGFEFFVGGLRRVRAKTCMVVARIVLVLAVDG
jgi:hypothetical protein